MKAFLKAVAFVIGGNLLVQLAVEAATHMLVYYAQQQVTKQEALLLLFVALGIVFTTLVFLIQLALMVIPEPEV